MNRRSLPEPVFESDVEFVQPATQLEKALASIFQQVLEVQQVNNLNTSTQPKKRNLAWLVRCDGYDRPQRPTYPPLFRSF